MNKYCNISLIILFFTLCTSIKSQEKFSKESADSLYKSNLYFRALVTGIDKMYKNWGKMDDVYGNQIRTDYKNMIVEDNGILSKVPEKYGPYTIQYLTVPIQNSVRANLLNFSIILNLLRLFLLGLFACSELW